MDRDIGAGKAVFCEKPITTDIEGARALVKDCADNPLPVFVVFNRRFDDTHRRLKEHITSGDVGAPEVVVITSRDPNPPPPAYVAATPGGSFYDTMIHDFDLAVWLLGERPVSLYAAASSLVEEELNPHRDMDTAAVTMRTESGKLCQINVSRRSATDTISGSRS
jgi:myo-inositol 2-dehydrogenase/D-chiro-inositol 1-dehydrogenase